MNPIIRRQTLADLLRRTAQRLPHKLAMQWGATRWGYAEFDALVTRLAAGLAGRGIAPGERVAVLARNSHGFAARRFADSLPKNPSGELLKRQLRQAYA